MLVNQIINALKKMGCVKFRDNPRGVYSNCPLYWRHEKGKDEKPSLFVFASEDRESYATCHACNFTGTMSDLVWEARTGLNINVQDLLEYVDRCEMGESSLEGQEWFENFMGKLKTFDQVPNYVRHDEKLQNAVRKNKVLESQWIIPFDGQEIKVMEHGDSISNFTQEEMNRMIVPYLNEIPDYWYKRGYGKELANFFNIGLQKNFLYRKIKNNKHYKISFGPRLLITIKDLNNKFVGWSGRAISDENNFSTEKDEEGNPVYISIGSPKYLHCPVFKRNNYLYGEHLIDKSVPSCILVEGFFDVIKMHSYGYKNVLGIMGTHLGKNQAAKLKKFFKRVIVFLDGDKAGHLAGEEMVKKYGQELNLEVIDVNLYQGKDPGDMSEQEVMEILADVF